MMQEQQRFKPDDYEAYLTQEIKRVYGDDGCRTILRTLSDVENGFCGVELYEHTFPDLLRAKGIEPKHTYSGAHGVPPQDGESAATPSQRQVIRDALAAAGFSIGG